MASLFERKKIIFCSRERDNVKVKVELGPDLFLIRKDLLIRRDYAWPNCDYMECLIIFSLQTLHNSGLKYNFQLIGIFLITERFYKFLIHFFPPRQVYKRNETPQILPIWWMNFTWEILKVIFLIIPPSECSGANF